MTSARPKLGVPVLAYLTSEPSSLSCHLRIFKNDSSQISFALHIAATLRDAEEEHAFIAQYDCDNFRSAALDLVPVYTPFDRLDKIARHADPDPKTLTLNLKRPAPIWCPLRQAIAPRAEAESVATFNELVNVTKATAVHLVVDFKWLAPDIQATIKQMVKGKRTFNRFPLDKYYARHWELKNWTDFAPATAPEPLYKRPRPVSSSSSSPPAKRAIADPNAPSPTEVASSPPDYHHADFESDFQTQAISRVIARELPTLVDAALPAVLTTLLPQQMPLLMPLLFVDPPAHINSFDSDASSLPQLQLTTMGKALIPPLLRHLKPQIQDIQDHALRRTSTRRENAALEFEEDVDNLKLDLKQTTEDVKMDLQREVARQTDEWRHELREALKLELMEEGKDIAVDVSDQVRLAAEDAVEGTLSRLKDIDRRALGRLVEWEIAQRLGRPEGVQCCQKSRLRGVRTGKGACRAVRRRPRTSVEPLPVWQALHRSAERQMSTTSA